MRSKYYFLFVIFITSHCSGQKIDAQKIWDNIAGKEWIMSIFNEPGTWELLDPKRPEKMEYTIINFRRNGTFDEIAKAGCGNGRRRPFSGAWRVSGDTIIVATYQGPMLYYRIIKIDPTIVKYE